MKINMLAILSLLNVFPLYALDWRDPPVFCPEEMLPKGHPCLDFSKVKNVYTDFPKNTSQEEMKDWKTNKTSDLRLCRNKEVLRRNNKKPGSYSAATIEEAWMVVKGAENATEKLSAIKAASLKYQIPAQILLGALKQESLLSTLGVSPDGGNYSCGISQLNIQEWCTAMNKKTAAEKTKLGWPLEVDCENAILPTDIVKPFYELAAKKLGNRKSYELTSQDFEGIIFAQVVDKFPVATEDIQQARFEAISSFVKHCQDVAPSIDFKAQTLRSLYLNFVPKELREKNVYINGESFKRQCSDKYTLGVYPLHTGWLLAVAMYNAGPRQRTLVDHYFQIQNNQYPNLTPLDLVEALHWGGKHKIKTGFVEFYDQAGNVFTQKWFKSCIVQRHIARVVQITTLPSFSIAKSLEQVPCMANDIVPDYRQNTSGVKEY